MAGSDGVTYSGGEPFLQAAPLAALSERLQAAGLGIACSSGYTRSELEGHPDPAVRTLLARLDLLIDGPFVQARRAPLRCWRGSANQHVHFLSARYADYAPTQPVPAAQVELSLGATGRAATGFWPEALLSRLKKVLEG